MSEKLKQNTVLLLFHHSPDQLNWSDVPIFFELKKIDKVFKAINFDKDLTPVLFSIYCAVALIGTTTASSPYMFFKYILVEMSNLLISSKKLYSSSKQTLTRNKPWLANQFEIPVYGTNLRCSDYLSALNIRSCKFASNHHFCR